MPGTGTAKAQNRSLLFADEGRVRDAVAAVVLIDRVDVTVPLAEGVTEFELNEQPDASEGVGETEQVRLTAPLKPFSDVIEIVEVADCPALTVFGVTVPALTVKSGAACTVKARGVL